MKKQCWRPGLKAIGGLTLWGFLGVLILLPVLWMTIGESNWLLVALRYAPPVAYLVTLVVVAGFARLCRVRCLWMGTLAGFLFVLFCYLGFQIPSQQAGKGKELSILSFNIHAGLAGDEAIGDYLSGSGCDIIGLQEARKPLIAPNPDPVPKILSKMPGYETARGGTRGELVTLSRYPIESVIEHPLGDLSTCVESLVSIEGTKLRVLNTHFMTGPAETTNHLTAAFLTVQKANTLLPPRACTNIMTGDPKGALKGKGLCLRRRLLLTAETRHIQAMALRDIVTENELPVVITGDFNSPPNSSAYEILSAELQDSFAKAGLGFGFTYRENLPLWRIDYIWLKGLQASKCQIVNPALSDHKAVRAVVRLK